MNRYLRFGVFVSFVVSLIILTACNGIPGIGSGGGDATSKATGDRYSKLEIKNYKGTNLDPSVGPRDNSINGIQNVDIATYSLKISGLVDKPTTLSYDDVLKMDSYEKLIILHCVEGWDATILWKGALLDDIIQTAKATSKANTVIFHCVDGYTTSLPLQTIIDKKMILAYSSNGIVLPNSLGFPFIVVAEDKLGYKWARWVNEIELADNPNYTGFWESRGYDNNADVPANRK